MKCGSKVTASAVPLLPSIHSILANFKCISHQPGGIVKKWEAKSPQVPFVAANVLSILANSVALGHHPGASVMKWEAKSPQEPFPLLPSFSRPANSSGLGHQPRRHPL